MDSAPPTTVRGEPVKIPAKRIVKFLVAKAAKDAIFPPKIKM
jgi:nucleoid DNA-binding protein